MLFANSFVKIFLASILPFTLGVFGSTNAQAAGAPGFALQYDQAPC
jgi:hypothetical protein